VARTGNSHASVYRALQEEQSYPYPIQTVQELVPHDAPARRAFCQWTFQQSAEEPTRTAKVLVTDKSCFNRAEITNIHNEYVWSGGNPHEIRSYH
jgi:hypothetical protein